MGILRENDVQYMAQDSIGLKKRVFRRFTNTQQQALLAIDTVAKIMWFSAELMATVF